MALSHKDSAFWGIKFAVCSGRLSLEGLFDGFAQGGYT